MATKKNTKEERKAKNEKRIFSEFAVVAKAVANLEIELSSIVNEDPPKPDISCLISGQKHYFEMTEITDEDLARRVSISLKDNIVTGGFFSQDGPLVDAFTKKEQKTYLDLDGPLELLAYYEKQYPPPKGKIRGSTLYELDSRTQGMTVFGQWKRLWIYDTWNKRILGLFESKLPKV